MTTCPPHTCVLPRYVRLRNPAGAATQRLPAAAGAPLKRMPPHGACPDTRTAGSASSARRGGGSHDQDPNGKDHGVDCCEPCGRWVLVVLYSRFRCENNLLLNVALKFFQLCISRQQAQTGASDIASSQPPPVLMNGRCVSHPKVMIKA